MEMSAVVGALAGLITVAAPVVVYLVRIEHRMTKMEVMMMHALGVKS